MQLCEDTKSHREENLGNILLCGLYILTLGILTLGTLTLGTLTLGIGNVGYGLEEKSPRN